MGYIFCLNVNYEYIILIIITISYFFHHKAEQLEPAYLYSAPLAAISM